jgi:hypothetical protein
LGDRQEREVDMLRSPRVLLPLSAVAIGVAASLLVATAATGRSQAAPSNTKEPFITYVYPIKVGTVLNGNKGSWSGSQPIDYAYQWLRCNDNGESCKHISNATGTTYSVVNNDEGHTLRLDVTASNNDGKATARANATSQVPKKPGAPVELTPPEINGDAIVGEKLTATTGTWKGNTPISYTFKWQTCNAATTSCPGNGATGNTYTVKANDQGQRLRVKVLAKNNAGQTAALSAPTATVKEQGGGGGSVAVGSLKAGDRLVVEAVHFSPNPVTSKSSPIQVSITITDQKGNPVKGALVSVVSTPVVTSSPTPAQTDSNGSVIYNVRPESDFPIKNGYSVQFYVKGYRQGDPTLAGVSGGRLVQVATRTP